MNLHMLIDRKIYSMAGGSRMTENNNGVYIFPDANDFLEFMEGLQEEYNKNKEDNPDGK